MQIKRSNLETNENMVAFTVRATRRIWGDVPMPFTRFYGWQNIQEIINMLKRQKWCMSGSKITAGTKNMDAGIMIRENLMVGNQSAFFPRLQK